MPKFIVEANPKENPVYPNSKSDHFINIVSGPYEGTHFTFGKIEFLGEDEEGNGNISFDYDLLFIPETLDLLEQKQDIESAIAAVLQDVLENLLNEEEDETRNVDTEQPTEG